MENEVYINTRRTGNVLLKNFDVAEPQDYMEVTEWTNGGGYDITIMTSHWEKERNYKLSVGEFQALKSIINQLDQYDK